MQRQRCGVKTIAAADLGCRARAKGRDLHAVEEAPREPHRLLVAETHRYEISANWKTITENYHECYHCPGTHPEYCAVSSWAASINSPKPDQHDAYSKKRLAEWEAQGDWQLGEEYHRKVLGVDAGFTRESYVPGETATLRVDVTGPGRLPSAAETTVSGGR